MPQTRKNHSPSLKAKVAVEAIRGGNRSADREEMLDVHPTQVGG